MSIDHSWQNRAKFPDTVIIAHPRSGLTWLRFMLHEVRLRLHPEELIGRKIQEQNPLIKQNHDEMGLGTCQRRSWFKSPQRFLMRKRARGNKWSHMRVLFLLRDPRDALVSNWYRLCRYERFDQRIFQREFAIRDFVRDPAWGIAIFCTWLNWWAENRRRVKDFCLVLYENLLHDPIGELEAILNWVGLECPFEIVEQAAEASQFDRMQAAERRRGTLFRDLRAGDKKRPETMIVRKGGVGGWRQEMDLRTKVFCWQHMRTLKGPFNVYGP